MTQGQTAVWKLSFWLETLLSTAPLDAPRWMISWLTLSLGGAVPSEHMCHLNYLASITRGSVPSDHRFRHAAYIIL